MRLAQISRKLNIKPTVIINYLEKELDVKVLPVANTKIQEEHVALILTHFTTAEEETAVSVVESEELEQVEEVNEASTQTDVSPVKSENTDGAEEDFIEEHDLNIQDGVIRIPKIEMKGVKVVGKIDLTPPKVDSEIEESEEGVSETDEGDESEGEADEVVNQDTAQIKPPKREGQRKYRRKRESKQLNYSDEVQKEQQKYEEELRQKRALEKRRKEAYYKQMMRDKSHKSKNTSRSKKSKQKKVPQFDHKAAQVEEEVPKGVWRKFIKWLNT